MSGPSGRVGKHTFGYSLLSQWSSWLSCLGGFSVLITTYPIRSPSGLLADQFAVEILTINSVKWVFCYMKIYIFVKCYSNTFFEPPKSVEKFPRTVICSRLDLAVIWPQQHQSAQFSWTIVYLRITRRFYQGWSPPLCLLKGFPLTSKSMCEIGLQF